jgi:hypothetical protein
VAGSSPVFRSLYNSVGNWQSAVANCILPTGYCKSRGSSGVEHFLGREGVVSSILTYGSFKTFVPKLVQQNKKADGLQALNDNQFSKQILKIKQWQKNLSKGINPI